MRKNHHFVVFAAVMIFLSFAGCSHKSTVQPPSVKTGTGAVSKPVPLVSAMTPEERQYMVWLLLKRQELKLADVPVKLLKSVANECQGCMTIYFQWGAPVVKARITVKNNAVTAAVDTTGFDYLTKQQGSPISFDELRS